MAALPSPLRSWLEDVLGVPWRATQLASTGAQAELWRVVTKSDTFVLKRHRSTASFARELRAYRRWAPHLGAMVPPLVAASEAPSRALLLEHIEGVLVGHAAQLLHEPQVFEQAGAFWAALAEIPDADDDALDLREGLRLRFEAWLARARGKLPDSLLAAAEARFEPQCFEGAARSPCHRDFAPHNWIYDAATRKLTVIDFGQARLDSRLSDLVKLTTESFRQTQGAEEAFYRGAGYGLTARDRLALRQLELLHGLATATWAVDHADEPLRERGLAILRAAST